MASDNLSKEVMKMLVAQKIQQYERDDVDCIVHRYYHEKNNISKMQIECNHQLARFDHKPGKFVSFIIYGLSEYDEYHKQYATMGKYDNFSSCKPYRGIYLSKSIPMNTIDGTRLIKNGFCQQCAYRLAAELSYNFENSCIQTMTFLYVHIFQFPALATYYLKHKKLWKKVMKLFVYCCRATDYNRGCKLNRIDEYTFIATYGDCILRNGYVMRKSKYWRKYIEFMMNYTVRSFKYILTVRENDTEGVQSIFRVQLMIMLFLHYRGKIPRKSRQKYERYIVNFAKEIRNIHDGINDIWLKANTIKEWCSQLMEMINCQSSELGEDIVNIQHKIWKMKRENMKCLWSECDKRAKDLRSGKLHKCKGCGVARYCSKYCQKRDWKYGTHKRICDKFQFLRQIR